MPECNQGIIVPSQLIIDPCGGKRTSTNCIITENAITYLSLPLNSTLTEIINALVLSLSDARNRVNTLEIELANLINQNG
jgi:hypothetical protein